jgi:formylglycine-generating enzyme required for sulfatase activity
VAIEGLEAIWIQLLASGKQLMTLPCMSLPLFVFFSFCLASATSHAAVAQQLEAFQDPTTGMEFVLVEGSCFRMGSPPASEERFSNEEPHHEVCLNSFWMGKYEVTQDQYAKVTGDNPSSFKGKNRPVENVTRLDAQSFIHKLNKMSGKSYRLPTEAEWEFAAMGGTRSRGYTYSGSNNPDVTCWFEGNSGKETHPVGQKQPNEIGLFDMSGNVAEWCKDWYDAFFYATSPKYNPEGPSSGKFRSLRGGGWRSPARYTRTENREWAPPSGYNDDIGFRILLPKQDSKSVTPPP